MAFRHGERCGPLLKEFHACRAQLDAHLQGALLWKVYSWLLAPFSLWPIDFEGLSKYALARIRSGAELGEELALLLQVLDAPPDEKTQKVVGEFEAQVEAGNYESLIRGAGKFEELEAELAANEEVMSAWKEIQRHHNPKEYQNSRGVIRRRLSQERNFREGWQFDWDDARKRFYSIFDALCHRWCLYGFERDKPLLLKISVNPTPHGTMIVIPRDWSLDPVRDLDWGAIGKIHRAHGARRQGPKLSATRIQQRRDAVRAKKLWDQAFSEGLRGQDRVDYVGERMHKDLRTDPSWLKRLLHLAKHGTTRRVGT